MKTARPKTETSIPYPPKKSAGKSLNISTTSDNEYSVTANTQIPEMPFRGGWIQYEKALKNALGRRVPFTAYRICEHLIGETTCHARRPEFAAIGIREWQMLTGASRRAIFYALKWLEENKLISRNQVGAIKFHPENVRDVPLMQPRRKCRPRTLKAPDNEVKSASAAAEPIKASVRAVVQSVALRNEPEKPEIIEQYSPAIEPAAAPAPAIERRIPGTYCTWGWTCPNLSPTENAYLARFPQPTGLIRIDIPELDTYLARFVDPAQRIGDATGVDDAAARRIWAKASTRTPGITAREVLHVIQAKRNEWGRHSDRLPGRKIESLTGLVIKSIANACEGAPYYAAREAARMELERDACNAEEFLCFAGGALGPCSPRDEARALGVLAEAGRVSLLRPAAPVVVRS